MEIETNGWQRVPLSGGGFYATRPIDPEILARMPGGRPYWRISWLERALGPRLYDRLRRLWRP